MIRAILLIAALCVAMTGDTLSQGFTTLGVGSFTGGPPATPCNAGQLDWSDPTGCNLTFAGH